MNHSRPNRVLIPIFIAALISSGTTRAAMQTIPLPDTLAERVDAVVIPYLDAGMFSGVVLIAEGDEVLLLKAYGRASYELEVPMETSTKFRIASLSKQFTSAALAVLLDRGVLSPESRVSEFIPSFPRGDDIRLTHLVHHTSGVPHTNTLAELEGVTHMELAELITLLATKGLDFDPGTGNSYSNGGYDLPRGCYRIRVRSFLRDVPTRERT